jgi:protein-L-isoaspartate(D-aspartate) O-methyltransferase
VTRPFGGASNHAPGDDESFAVARARMVETQLRARGIRAPGVLAAMAVVPRQAFVPFRLRDLAYADEALPIEHGQTISQPFIVGLMTELLAPEVGTRVLDIGTGSGYQAAVLAAMGCRVTSVERVPELAASARARLEALGFGDRVEILIGDGSAAGWGEAAGRGEIAEPSEVARQGGAVGRGLAAEPSETADWGRATGLSEAAERSRASGWGEAPWPRIIVAAAAPEVPEGLLAQLADGGRLVIPVGGRREQTLVLVERDGPRLRTTRHGACVFVPLIGEGGFR